MKRTVLLSAILAVALTSCNDLKKPDSIKTKEEIEYDIAWEQAMGKVDPEQTWISSKSVTVEVKDAGDAQISIYSLSEAQRTLLARETVSSSATIRFDMPLGLDYGVAVCRETAEGTEYIAVSKADLLSGNAGVSFAGLGTKAGDNPPMSSENKDKLTIATCVNPLTGKRAKIWGYTSFPGWIWNDMNAAIPENKAATTTGQITNFELQSNGLFYVSTIYGATGVTNAEIGYYYYDPATPSQKTFIPLVDALGGDYYYDEIDYSREDALAKVLWLNKDTWEWTPANFCFYDKVSGMANGGFATRKGDNQFNALSIVETYGKDINNSSIAMVKGLTFQVDAPKGNMVGFYCKRSSYTNYTTKEMNTNKKSRAAIKVYDGFRFIGLEDGSSDGGNEPDCNDIALVMVPGNDGTLPGLVLPYIKDIEEDKYYNGDGTKTDEPKYDVATDGPDSNYEDLASSKAVWTLAFEDMSTIGDFDFNDVVLAIVPDGKKRSADVWLCATGGSINAYIYYKDKLIGEAHQLLGSVENGKNVIANTYVQKYPIKKILTVEMHPGHQLEDEARNFKVVAGNNVITLPEKGEIPKAICVGGTGKGNGNIALWAWPKESTRIDTAYPDFEDWAADYKNDKNSSWYKKPVEDKVVRF